MIDVVKGITSTIDLAKKAMQANEAMKTNEAKLAIADLIGQLAELKIQCSELITENHHLKTELTTAKKVKRIELSRNDDVYMNGDDGPFCTTCWDQNVKKIRLKEEIKDFQFITGQKYICPVCQSRHKGID